MKGYRDLKVWQKGMDLAEQVYRLSRKMPKEEQYRMTSQLLRAVASVPANIAEGYQRGSRKEYAYFIGIARGSLAETETFLMLATRAGLLNEKDTAPCLTVADEISRMLFALRKRLSEGSGNRVQGSGNRSERTGSGFSEEHSSPLTPTPCSLTPDPCSLPSDLCSLNPDLSHPESEA